MGERTPHLDPDARAALVGLAANHGRGHIIRAILEGVAFSLRDSFSIFAEMQVPVTRHSSRRRRRAFAAVASDSGRRLRPLGRGGAAEEGAAYGAALLAGVGAGTWSSVDEACQRMRPRREAGRSRSRHQRNHESTNTSMYRRIYPALREIRRNSNSSAAS